MASPSENLIRAAQWLGMIGLEVSIQPKLPEEGFLEHCLIQDGRLLCDYQCSASNLLHEAGHLAVVPNRYRHLIGPNVDEAIAEIFLLPEVQSLPPDHPLLIAMLQASECEASAWAWAAGCAIGLPPEAIIEDGDYNGDGQSVREMIAGNAYFGINGLAHAGMCRRRSFDGQPSFPAMTKWLQDAEP